jgi:hypothetical protein
MAILRGMFDGTVVPLQPIMDGAGVATFLAVSNNGPNNIIVNTSLGSSYAIPYANSQAFYLPSGTSVHIDGLGSTASWELAVPG